jgi:hypothetical protein
MNMQQLQQELAQLQMEMMNVQAKYANKPEDYPKMNQELAALSQKMNELSMQYASAAMTESYGSDVDLSDFLEDDGEEIQQFILDNPVPPGTEKYMPIGALLLTTHGEPWPVLAMTSDKDYWMDVLKGGWDIKKIDAGRKMLASLLEGRHASKFGDDFRKAKAGQPNELDGDSIENYNDTLEGLSEDLPELLPYVQKCDNILAWDLERVGYLARIFHSLGWIDDAEVFDWLAKAAEKIKTTYSSWEEYVAAILVGRAIAYSFDYIMIGSAYEIVIDGKEFLEAHPLKSL